MRLSLPSRTLSACAALRAAAIVLIGSAAAPALGQTAGGMVKVDVPASGQSHASGTSSDGSVVVGWTEFAQGVTRAFRWTSASGAQDLGTLASGTVWTAPSVSDDGAVIAGAELVPAYAGPRAYRWTAATGMQDLGTLGGQHARAYDVNADGTVIVGEAQDAAGAFRAFRWTVASGMQDLGDWVPSAVSADGTVVIGEGPTSKALYWSAATGTATALSDLPSPGVTPTDLEARAVSADGRVVVGVSRILSSTGTLTGFRNFRWTAQTGVQFLPTNPTGSNVLRATTAVNADGSVVVGRGSDGDAWRWTAATGVHTLGTLGGPYAGATSVDDTGAIVVGWSFDAQSTQRGFRWELGVGAPIGESYCGAATNSSGGAANLRVVGSNEAAQNFVRLEATGLPARTIGVFLVAPGAGSVPSFAGGQGQLCIGTNHGLYVEPGQVQTTSSGRISLDVDLARTPVPGGFVGVRGGETWRFQGWYRDANPGLTSNLTNAVAIHFY